MARTTSLTWGEYTHFIKDWVHQYMSGQHYWKIEGRPVWALNNLADFVTRYGHITFAVMIRYACRIVQGQLGMPPYILGVIGEANPRNVRLANSLPLDGVTGYGLLPNWLGDPVQDYGRLIEERVKDWEELQRRLQVPFYPVVCTGWDASVRGTFRGELRAEYGYPYSPVVKGVTPQLFGYFVDCAVSFNRRWQPRENLVFLHAWNEWSESSVLEPNDKFGSEFLDEVRKRAFQMSATVGNGISAVQTEEYSRGRYRSGRWSSRTR
jgi:hypothetical protein